MHLTKQEELRKFIIAALQEDIGTGDHTSLASIPQNSKSAAQLLVKENGTIAGIEFAELVFKQIDESVIFTSFLHDGDKVKKGDIAFEVFGNAISILSAERLVLNCMQHMSAIASKTALFCDLIADTSCKLLDTRKTIPLNRYLEKWAVRIGGGYNHRFGLYDMIMIKDNHIDFAGGITQAIQKTKAYLKQKNLKLDIVVEARNLQEVKEILIEGGIKRILLDNFDIVQTKKAVAIIGDICQTESSGGITAKNIKAYANCGVDFISVGAITHSSENFDLSLKAKK